MRAALILALILAAPAPLLAQEAKPPEPEKPITERSPTMGDAVTTPVSDLNLKKDPIPPLLIAAQDRPYDLAGLRRCSDISAAVRELDAMLGPDLDLPQETGRKTSAGSVAQAAVGSFIPFRGLIREISGANDSQRRLQTAIQAGIARRSFLKGIGTARGCRYPAGPAQLAALAAPTPTNPAATAPATARTKRQQASRATKDVTFISQPVVQPTGQRKK